MDAQRPIKLYLAILNHGYLRREITSTILPLMSKTPGVKLIWENPGKTWSNPISSNRNHIVKRFLATDCDFLMTLDDDVVPEHNPAELVYANKDIIGSPARVRQAGGVVNWVAYVKHPDAEGYVGVDLGLVDSDAELLEVDIVGTGCILIRRNVLEALKAPFHPEFDEDGIQKFGTDFAFCRKAKAAGFEIYATPWRRCEHFKAGFGLNQMDAYDPSDFHDSSPARYKYQWGGYAISQKDWHFIKQIIEEVQPDRILEFGAGLSSLLMSEQCPVVSYEADAEYAAEILAKRIKINEEQSINKLEILAWDGEQIEDDRPYDLAFIDGPKGKAAGGPGRQHSIRIAAERAKRIIVHDAGRADESRWQEKYLRPNFKLIRWNGAHIQRCNYWVRKTDVGQ